MRRNTNLLNFQKYCSIFLFDFCFSIFLLTNTFMKIKRTKHYSTELKKNIRDFFNIFFTVTIIFFFYFFLFFTNFFENYSGKIQIYSIFKKDLSIFFNFFFKDNFIQIIRAQHYSS